MEKLARSREGEVCVTDALTSVKLSPAAAVRVWVRVRIRVRV